MQEYYDSIREDVERGVEHLEEEISKSRDLPQYSEGIRTNIREKLLRAQPSVFTTERIAREINATTPKNGVRAHQEIGCCVSEYRGIRSTLEKNISLLIHARDEVVTRNQKLVIKYAKKFEKKARKAGSAISLMDLIGEGNIGLIRAWSDFDQTRGLKLSTYLVNWIEQKMSKGIRQRGRTIRHPSYTYDEGIQIERARQKLYTQTGTTPTNKEIFEMAGLSEAAFNRQQAISLNRIVSSGTQDIEIISFMQDEKTPSGAQYAEKVDMVSYCVDLLKGLSTKERRVICGRIYEDPQKTYQALGEELCLSRERIRQIEHEALNKLKLRISWESVRPLEHKTQVVDP